MNNNRDKQMIIAIIFFIVAAIAILLFTTGVFSSSSIDDFPEDAVGIDITTQAKIVNGEELLRELGSVESYDNLSKDLYLFGVTAYEPYAKKETDLVGFEVKSTTRNNENITVIGGYGSSDNEVQIEVVPLKNGRISVSITDKESELNIDEQLPSNSQLNQFVGTLPIENTGYTIDYLEDSGDFTVNVFNNPNNYAEAEAIIFAALSETPQTEISIVRYGVGDLEIDNGF